MMLTVLELVFKKSAVDFSEYLNKNIEITKIDDFTLRIWTETWKTNNDREPPNGGWDWVYKTRVFEKKYNKYLISVALWENGLLCGLALAKKSKGNDNISIYYIEGSTNQNNPLKGFIFPIIETVYLEYAKINKINKIMIIEPVENLNIFYSSYGYTFPSKRLFKKKYCVKEVSS